MVAHLFVPAPGGPGRARSFRFRFPGPRPLYQPAYPSSTREAPESASSKRMAFSRPFPPSSAALLPQLDPQRHHVNRGGTARRSAPLSKLGDLRKPHPHRHRRLLHQRADFTLIDNPLPQPSDPPPLPQPSLRLYPTFRPYTFTRRHTSCLYLACNRR